jgi:hypothetical protein
VNSTHASDKFDYEEPEGEGEEDKEFDNQDDNKYGGKYGENQHLSSRHPSSRHEGGASDYSSYKKDGTEKNRLAKTSQKHSEKCKYCKERITSK